MLARRLVLRASVLALLSPPSPARSQEPDARIARIVAAAVDQVGKTRTYDPAYRRLDYPGGDVPIERGVCTDVLVRAYRAIGVDLQVLVHEDVKRARGAYPAARGDPNIDHRRVSNLVPFFQRHGEELPVTRDPDDWRPGDVVVWRLPSGRGHIGLVTDRAGADGRRLVAHHLSGGTRVEDVLFTYRITHHFRYLPAPDRPPGQAGRRARRPQAPDPPR